MAMWDEQQFSAEEQRRIEHRAQDDALACADLLWQGKIPNYTGDFRPLAIDATHAFIARWRQESAGLPGWVLRSGQEMMRRYIQWVGNRYCDAFLKALAEHIKENVPRFYGTPRTTPLPSPISMERQQQRRRDRERRGDVS